MLRDVREGQVTFHLEEATIDDLHRAIRGGKDKLRRSGRSDMVIMTSVLLVSSAGVSTTFAPKPASLWAFAAVRFQTISW